MISSLMLDGVPLEEGWRRERLVHAKMREQKIDFLQTMVIATASANPDNLQNVMQDYLEAIAPSEKMGEEFIEKNADILEQESQKIYGIEEVFSAGEA